MAKKRDREAGGSAKVSGGSLMALVKRFDRAEAAFQAAMRELDSRQAELDVLRRQLASRLGGVASMDSAVAPRGTPRSGRGAASAAVQPRAGTLKHAILQVMKDGGTRGPTEVFDAVQKSGFKSDGSDKSQRVMVAQTLAKLVQSGHLIREGRGAYRAA
ncbi:MAG: hypothetical protein U0638_05465 [Phycisphaerales bacterium]